MTEQLTAPRRAEVLVVDDDRGLRTLVELVLRRLDLTVWSASSGQEGISVYRERHRGILAVLLAVRMPGLDGPATLAALREIDPAVRCCFLGDDADQYAPDDLLGLGTAHLFHKPVTDWGVLEQTLSEMAGVDSCHGQ
jgi:CheY-like chemotaxis protein